MLPETVVKLSQIPNIVGIKEASGSMDQVSEIVKNVKKENFTVLSGDDSLTIPLMSIGGKGVISVISNIMPKKITKMVKDFEDGNIEEAMKEHLNIFDLVKALFIETNPVPVKTALAMMGMIKEDVRLPLCEMSQSNREKLKRLLIEHKLIKE